MERKKKRVKFIAGATRDAGEKRMERSWRVNLRTEGQVLVAVRGKEKNNLGIASLEVSKQRARLGGVCLVAGSSFIQD